MCNTVEEAIERLKLGDNFRYKKFDYFRNDFKVVFQAILHNSEAILYCGSELKSKNKIIQKAYKRKLIEQLKRGENFYHEKYNEFRNDKEVCLVAVEQERRLYHFKKNSVFFYSYKNCSDLMKLNPEVIDKALRKNSEILELTPLIFRNLCIDKDPLDLLEKLISLNIDKVEEHHTFDFLQKLIDSKNLYSELQAEAPEISNKLLKPRKLKI